MSRLLAVLLLLAFASTAGATAPSLFSERPEPIPPEYLPLVPKSPPGAVSWKLLEDVTFEYRLIDGQYEYEPIFSDEILALDGTTVKVIGYILPLEQGERHENFLLAALPPHCPFCLPAGPARIVEVLAADPVRYTADPILIEGRFEVLRDDGGGLLYRLREARAIR